MRSWVMVSGIAAVVLAVFMLVVFSFQKKPGLVAEVTPTEAQIAAMLPPVADGALRPVTAFAVVKDDDARAVALFREAGKVIEHPRCVNCHPAGDVPTQTSMMTPHQPPVVRGADGLGAPGMRCGTCHHEANFDVAGVPGNPAWALAPIEMAWAGKSLGEICAQLKDPARNGGRDLAGIVEHMTHDGLVGWGWNPGGNRTPVPGTQAEFGALIKAWVDSGAACPAS